MHHPSNERIKRQYLTFLKEARRHSEATVDAVAKALARFETDAKYRDFKAFRPEQAKAFKERLSMQRAERSGEKLSKATLHSTLSQLKVFFQWLACQPGYKSRLNYADAEYFNLSDKDVRIATAKREQVGPTLEQVKHVIAMMPAGTEIERRDRALIAFTLLTGARDGAIATLKLKHIDLAAGSVYQDAREVKTKFGKTFTTFFFPVGDEIREIVEAWVRYLREEKLWGTDDPLFPATRIAVGANHQFEAVGVQCAHWSTAARIRTIFREAFARADLPYFNPHSFRHTLVRLGEEMCKSPEEFKAWSQNLGHEQVLTTFLSYGSVASSRQRAIVRALCVSPALATENADVAAIVNAVVRQIRAIK